MAQTTLIGIDVGTTALKAILMDDRGRRLSDFNRPYPIARPQSGHAEHDPADWMNALLAALHQFEDQHDLGGLAGIGICSQVNTHVFVGGDGMPLLPAIIWQDSRAAADAARLDARVRIEQKLAWFGAPVPIDASHALSRMAHVRSTHPSLYAATRHVLLPKDFCVLQLTGVVASDPVSAVGLTNPAGYVEELIDLVPGAREKLPPLFRFSHVAGRVRPGLPCAGTPVVVGAMDAWGGMFGVGAVRDGDAMYQSGTSEIAGIVSRTIHPTPGVILFPPYEGITMHAAPTQAGGAALAWFAHVVGQTPGELSRLVAGTTPGSAIPLFLPHLQGERAPLWDSTSRGVFARLDPRAGTAEMARSVMEGVAFSVRMAFDALQRSAGTSLQRIKIGGGGSRSDVWCQIRADSLGIMLERAAAPDPAAIGAAILAGLGGGVFAALPDAVDRLVSYDARFEPDPAAKAYYDEKFHRYVALYEALRGFNASY